jgi:hypothetical protein
MATGVNCHRNHHFENVCRSKDNPKRQTQSRQHNLDKESAVFNTLCTLNSPQPQHDNLNTIQTINVKGQRQSIPLDHHIYDSMTDTWFRRNSTPQPFVIITVRALPKDYSAFGVDLSTPSAPTIIPAMADTGCQSCLASLRVIHRIGLSKSDLNLVTMRMHTANNDGIKILGA